MTKAGFDGLYLDGLVTEDEVNQLVGVTETASQTSIVADLTATGGVSSTDLTAPPVLRVPRPSTRT